MFATAKSSGFRTRVLAATAGLCALLGIGLLLEGPWWRIDTITVAGVHAIDPNSVQQVMAEYVRGRRGLIIPNQNLWLFSTRQAEVWLQKKIEARTSVESVRIEKIYPNLVHVTITERTPVAYIQSGEMVWVVDRQGKIIEAAGVLNPELPVIQETVDQPIGGTVFEPAVMESVVKLQSLLHAASLTAASWNLPVVTCPVYQNPDDLKNLNANVSSNSNVAVNSNTADLNLNRRASPLNQTCNDQALKQTRPEIHVQLQDGPEAWFDRFQDLGAAVQRVRRILTQPNPPHQYIDVRFGDRVFVR